ncbi:hypothetical protein [Stenotrophomonas maltophilia]|uniref:hypothetical protein n=1 Tax=Stenotrophomonas maltophilia TaxID=40324 RepID=UPI003D18E4BA
MAAWKYNMVDISPQTLRDVHLPPFKAAFDAGAITVMSSFNDHQRRAGQRQRRTADRHPAR